VTSHDHKNLLVLGTQETGVSDIRSTSYAEVRHVRELSVAIILPVVVK
jgi:hypothetical protein